NAGAMPVPQDSLPKNRMRHAQVGPDENKDIRFLEVVVGERRRIEAERFLVRRYRGGHALARIAVSVADAHSHFPKHTEKGQFFGCNLPGPQPGKRIRTVLLLNALEFLNEHCKGGFPTNGPKFALRVT